MSSQTTIEALNVRPWIEPSDVTYVHDLGGNFKFLNPAGERISGYSCEEVRRMNISDIVAPEVGDHLSEQIVRNVTERIGTVYEIDIIAKDGRRVPMEVSTRAVLREGQVVEIEGIAVPSVLRGEAQPGLRCVDDDFVLIC